MISIDKIYDLMADKGFQEPRTGNLFFPAYIYTYKPEEEYVLRKQIGILIDKLKRPNHYLDSLVINIYEELIDYLKNETFAGKSLFDLVIEKEKENPLEALSWVREEINHGEFYKKFEAKVKEYFKDEHEKRVYLIIYGFGSVFPYLRASELLKRTERLIKEFKVIIFYPGKYKDSNYSLFGILNDENLYRANNLNRHLCELID
jgi:hypothetical protein